MTGMILAAGRCNTEALAIGAGEGGIAAEAGTEAAFRCPHTIAYKLPCVKQAALGQIIINRLSRLFPELAHHMILADKEKL